MAYDKSKKAELKAEIIKRVSEGESLLNVLKESYMPSRYTVYQWLLSISKDYDENFSNSYAYATDLRAEIIFNEVLEIADDTTNDYQLDLESGKMKVDHENIQRSRLRVDARKWVLAKMIPNKYSEKKQLEIKQDTKITGIDIEVIKSNEKKD